MVYPVTIGRQKSITLIKEAEKRDTSLAEDRLAVTLRILVDLAAVCPAGIDGLVPAGVLEVLLDGGVHAIQNPVVWNLGESTCSCVRG